MLTQGPGGQITVSRDRWTRTVGGKLYNLIFFVLPIFILFSILLQGTATAHTALISTAGFERIFHNWQFLTIFFSSSDAELVAAERDGGNYGNSAQSGGTFAQNGVNRANSANGKTFSELQL